VSERSVVAAHALHARPASNVVAAAGRFEAEITLINGEREASAKSILSVLGLDVPAGARVVVRAEGSDADAALDAVEAVLADA
jgi:phosphotransferase system HPr (HPr) family protein